MRRITGTMLTLLAVVAVVFIVLDMAGQSPMTAPPVILYRDDGGWVEIRGNDEDIRDYDAAGWMRKHIYSDLSGVRHTVEYDANGDPVSRSRTE